MMAPPSPTPIRIQPADYFLTQICLEPEISPDGRYVTYLRAGRDAAGDRNVGSLWLAAVDGSFDHPLNVDAEAGGFRALNAAAGTGAKWSPDSRQIAYVSSEDGVPSLILHTVATGATKLLCRTPRPVARLAWSPDGCRIAFLMPEGETPPTVAMPRPPEGSSWRGGAFVTEALTYRYDGGGRKRPERHHLFVVDLANGAIQRLSAGCVSFGGYGGFETTRGVPSWTPDARHIVITGRPEPDDFSQPNRTEVFVFDVANGGVRRLTDADGFKDAATVSPQGTLIAYIYRSNDVRMYRTPELWVMDLDAGSARPLAPTLDRPIHTFAWAPDSSALLAAFTDLGRTRLARVGLNGDVEVVADGIGSGNASYLGRGAQMSVARDSSAAFCTQDQVTQGDVVVLRGAALTRVTNLNADYFANRIVSPLEERWFRSSHDGKSVHGFVIKPPDFDPERRYPLILMIHGGPNAAYGAIYDYEKQMLAASGYVVLAVNPRGSIGYGQGFTDDIENDFPGPAITADLMSAVDAVVAEPWIDPTRLYVTGGSAGGTMTAWLIGSTRRFRAAAALFGVYDMQTFALTTDMPARVCSRWFKKTPWQDRDEYWRRSPLRLVPDVKTPTLVISGEEDWRVPLSQAEIYYTALKLHGIRARLVLFPGEGHGLADIPSNRLAKVSAVREWFDQNGGADA